MHLLTRRVQLLARRISPHFSLRRKAKDNDPRCLSHETFGSDRLVPDAQVGHARVRLGEEHAVRTGRLAAASPSDRGNQSQGQRRRPEPTGLSLLHPQVSTGCKSII